MTNQLRSPLRSSLRSPFEHRRGGFNPASLASSAFYDRTVLSTLFQDSAGTTPVTTTAQTIGLELDLSQGLALGPELVVNGGFTNGTADWASIGTGSISVVGGELQLNVGVSPAYFAGVIQAVPVEAGKSYKVEFTFWSPNSDRKCRFRIGGDQVYTNVATPTKQSFSAICHTSDTENLVIYADTTYDNDLFYFDKVSVTLIAGNHAIQPTAGKHAITAGSPIYADFDAVDDDIVTTFPTSLGAGCTVCRSLPATGASITTGVTIGTTFTDNVDAHALLIFTAAQWAALSAGQISQLTAWLNKKAGL